MVGIRVKKTGSKAVFKDLFLLSSFHLGLFPTDWKEGMKKWGGCLYHIVIYSQDWIEMKSNLKQCPIYIILKERQKNRFDRISNCHDEYFLEPHFQLEAFWNEAIPAQQLLFLSVAEDFFRWFGFGFWAFFQGHNFFFLSPVDALTKTPKKYPSIGTCPTQSRNRKREKQMEKKQEPQLQLLVKKTQ